MALLSEELGELSPVLERSGNSPEGFNTGLWLLTHPDLVRSARVSSFMDHLSAELSR